MWVPKIKADYQIELMSKLIMANFVINRERFAGQNLHGFHSFKE